jgi:hypothetical protein
MGPAADDLQGAVFALRLSHTHILPLLPAERASGLVRARRRTHPQAQGPPALANASARPAANALARPLTWPRVTLTSGLR